jgi:UDP-N-acetyl-D-glucosamine dehydrogenase
MPAFWVGKVAEQLNEDARSVRGSKVLVVGVAYKKDIDDVRESPAIDIMRLLQQQGAEVTYHDPYVPELREDNVSARSVDLSSEEVAAADCVVIVTDHSSLDYELLRSHAARIVDTRNVLNRGAES